MTASRSCPSPLGSATASTCRPSKPATSSESHPPCSTPPTSSNAGHVTGSRRLNFLVAASREIEATVTADVRSVLKRALDDGSAAVKQIAIDVIANILCNIDAAHVIECAREFGMLERIPIVVGLAVGDTVRHVLAAATMIIDVFQRNPGAADGVTDLMAGDDVARDHGVVRR
jgi:hypothetical protein